MSRGRVWLVHALLAALLGLTALSFARRQSLWPISHYPMFSQTRSRTDATALEVYVVGASGESPLPREGGTFFRDFDGVGVQWSVTRIAAASGADSEVNRRFLALLLAELQRSARQREDVAPTALRLYRVVWRFADARAPRRIAADRTLLFEVTGGGSR